MIDSVNFINVKNDKTYNSYKDFNFLIEDFEISEATFEEEIVDIPGTSSVIDFSKSLSGDSNYKRRTLNIFLNKFKESNYIQDYSKIQNALHGKEMKIIFSTDPEKYFIGTIKVGALTEPFKKVWKLTISCDIDPFKYDIIASDEDWIWDDFSFENGILNEFKDLVVDGELEIVIIRKKKAYFPRNFLFDKYGS